MTVVEETIVMELSAPPGPMIIEIKGRDKRFKLPPGFDTLIIPLGSGVEVRTDTGDLISSERGCVVFAPANEITVITLKGEFEALVLLSDVDARSPLGATQNSKFLENGRLASFNSPQLVNPVIKIARRLCENGQCSDACCVESVSRLLLSEIASLSDNAAKTKLSRPRLMPHALNKIDAFLEKNLEEQLTIDDLARVAQVSGTQFSRHFKAATGVSPFQYLIGKRLDRARQMLQEGGASIAEIAYATGFSSQSHLTETFKRHWGMPPGAYRRHCEARQLSLVA